VPEFQRVYSIDVLRTQIKCWSYSPFIQPNDGGNDMFVHISAVERAGLSGLAEGQKVNFEIKADKMRGKSSPENLSLA